MCKVDILSQNLSLASRRLIKLLARTKADYVSAFFCREKMMTNLANGHFYILSSRYINSIDPDRSHHVQSTKGGQRPFYLTMECLWDASFYWVIPIGHDARNKYLRLSQKRPDLVHHSKVRGEDSFYLISNMIPVKKSAFVREFTSNGKPMVLGKSEQKIIAKKVRRAEALLRQGKPLYPNSPDWYNYVVLSLGSL